MENPRHIIEEVEKILMKNMYMNLEPLTNVLRNRWFWKCG